MTGLADSRCRGICVSSAGAAAALEPYQRRREADAVFGCALLAFGFETHGETRPQLQARSQTVAPPAALFLSEPGVGRRHPVPEPVPQLRLQTRRERPASPGFVMSWTAAADSAPHR